MSLIKYASAQVLDVRGGNTPQHRTASLGHFSSFDDYKDEDEYLYVRVRAISSRNNANNDAWSAETLKQCYASFLHKPIFVDHHNHDIKRARGVIVDAQIHIEDEKTAALDPYYASPDCDSRFKPPTWVELLLEIDAKSFPKLAKAFIDKDIDSVSMGANVASSTCNVCNKTASTPSDFCKHIASGKGAYFDYVDPDTGHRTSRQAFEWCNGEDGQGVSFFEISGVFVPADSTALVSEVRSRKAAALLTEGNASDEEVQAANRLLKAAATSSHPLDTIQSKADLFFDSLMNDPTYDWGEKSTDIAAKTFALQEQIPDDEAARLLHNSYESFGQRSKSHVPESWTYERWDTDNNDVPWLHEGAAKHAEYADIADSEHLDDWVAKAREFYETTEFNGGNRQSALRVAMEHLKEAGLDRERAVDVMTKALATPAQDKGLMADVKEPVTAAAGTDLLGEFGMPEYSAGQRVDVWDSNSGSFDDERWMPGTIVSSEPHIKQDRPGWKPEVRWQVHLPNASGKGEKVHWIPDHRLRPSEFPEVPDDLSGIEGHDTPEQIHGLMTNASLTGFESVTFDAPEGVNQYVASLHTADTNALPQDDMVVAPDRIDTRLSNAEYKMLVRVGKSLGKI